MSYLSDIQLDDKNLLPATPEIEQERKVAIFDLLEKNTFKLPEKAIKGKLKGPFNLNLAIRDKRLVFDLTAREGGKVTEFHLSLSPFKQVVKDYWSICESYYGAVKNLPPGQIETIDMARRGIHNEGARILLERLDGKVEIDYDTSRRLFTLICVLHFGG
tara:strand:+ start:573 stop:1052 length:480 start_codon:yes stop_codon:yes gene_type:complete